MTEELIQALEGLLEIAYRFDGCPDQTCSRCLDTQARVLMAKVAVERAKAATR